MTASELTSVTYSVGFNYKIRQTKKEATRPECGQRVLVVSAVCWTRRKCNCLRTATAVANFFATQGN